MKEAYVISKVESQLNVAQRFFVNVHGSKYSQNGTPDILTCDIRAQFVGIECKVPHSTVPINQLRKCLEIIDSGGRAFIATDDFDLKKLDTHLVPVLFVEKNEDEFSEHLFENQFIYTTEIKRVE